MKYLLPLSCFRLRPDFHKDQTLFWSQSSLSLSWQSNLFFGAVNTKNRSSGDNRNKKTDFWHLFNNSLYAPVLEEPMVQQHFLFWDQIHPLEILVCPFQQLWHRRKEDIFQTGSSKTCIWKRWDTFLRNSK